MVTVAGGTVTAFELTVALPVVSALVGWAANSIRLALRVEHARAAEYGQMRRTIRAAVEGEHVIPVLAELICRWKGRPAISEFFLPTDQQDCVRDVADQLQGVTHQAALATLRRLYEDLFESGAYYDTSVTEVKVRGVLVPLFVILVCAVGWRVVVGAMGPVDEAIVWGAPTAAALVGVWIAASYSRERTALTALSGIENTYA